MIRTVVFAEIESEKSYRTALTFAKKPEYKIYVLRKKNERMIFAEGIVVLEIEERRQAVLQDALKGIEDAQGGIDLLVLSAGKYCEQDGDITEVHDYEALAEVLDENVIGMLEVVHASLELLRKGAGKRIALLTEKESSINLNKDVQNYGYLMSLGSLNMMMKILFNTLRPEGFTFRCYAGEDGGMSPENYLCTNLCYDKDDAYIHSDENRLVMRDEMLCEIPW